MSSISFKRSHNLVWSVRHNESGIILDFVEGYFNDKQKVHIDGVIPDAQMIARVMREIGDEVQKQIYFIALCDVDVRRSLIDDMSEDLLIEAAEKLHGAVGYEDYNYLYDDLDIFELIADPSPALCECLENLFDDEMKELVMLVDTPFFVQELRRSANDSRYSNVFIEHNRNKYNNLF